MATVPGGLMGVIDTIAGVQSRVHELLVVSPLEPRIAMATSRVAWVRGAIKGNLDLRGHRAALAVVRAFAPDVVFVHAGSPGELALAAWVTSRTTATVVIEHAPDHYPLRSRLRDAVLSKLKRRADGWVAVSTASARSLESLWKLPYGTIGVAHSGVNAPTCEPPSDDVVSLFRGKTVVLGVGRPTATKGFDVFSAIAEALSPLDPTVGFVWIGGEAPEKRGNVVLLPWHDSVGWMLARAALLLVPSRAEGVPLVLLEAWAGGRPVVASAVGGIPEVVHDGIDALLLPPGDTTAWVASVSRLLSDAEARECLGRRGREAWRSRFTPDAMCERYETIIRAVCEAREAAARPSSAGDVRR